MEKEASERPTTRSPSPPISQSFNMMTLRDDEKQEWEIHQSMGQTTRQQQTNQVSEFSAALREMRQENPELCEQFQSLMVALQSQPAAHFPTSSTSKCIQWWLWTLPTPNKFSIIPAATISNTQLPRKPATRFHSMQSVPTIQWSAL